MNYWINSSQTEFNHSFAVLDHYFMCNERMNSIGQQTAIIIIDPFSSNS